MKLINVVGARPNFIKMAPIISAMNRLSNQIFHTLVHTGQHYDKGMNQSILDDLGLPKPDINLGVGSGSQAEQTARIMMAFEKVCKNIYPDLVILVGDVNSTLACAITAKKLNIQVAHVEAGLRSHDQSMPEEINRIITDSISDYLFVTEKEGIVNLKKEGKNDDQIYFVGNVMIDTLFQNLVRLEGLEKDLIKPNFDIQPPRYKPYSRYAVITLHRPSNVDKKSTLIDIISALNYISEDLDILFPAHPRTQKRIKEFGLTPSINGTIKILPPLPYLSFLNLWKNADFVLTDSGGLQEETTALGIPCFTIRDNTERPITVEEGTNTLVGTKAKGILTAYEDFKNGKSKKGRIPDLWDGRAAERIVDILLRKFSR